MDGVGLPGGNDIIIRLILLKHHPHCPDMVTGIAPVPLCFEIAEIEFVLKPQFDSGCRPCNFSRYERLSPSGRLMIKENPVAGKNAVGIPVISADIIGIDLGRGIGTLRLKQCIFALRRRCRAEHFA